MLIRTGARHGLRWGLFGFVAALLTISSDRTQAAPYADIVVDANSGSVLHSTNPDARRHPASLTKIMTLYLLFERLEAGKLKLDSQLKVSQEAAGQDPTKLGLKAGSTIQVEDAIKGMITRSANDAAVVVAEAIAGDEDEFAKLMTRKALALGMSHTVYRNASGLPDDDQVTTARDQSTLGRAIQERFPKYYKYFSIRSFTFRGETIGNHNHLLGSVEGVDGIKTGYIGASGFNLVTSVHRGNRYIVAVVMGGSSAGARDSRMRELISDKIREASTKRTAPMVAEGFTGDTQEAKVESKSEPKVAKVEPKLEPKAESKGERKVAVAIIDPKDEPTKAEAKPETNKPRFAVASAASVPVRLAQAPTPQAEPAVRVTTGSTDPIRPVLVRTVTVHAGPQTATPAALSAATLPAAIPHSGQLPVATKPEPKAAKPEPKPEPKVEAKVEPKPEPKPEPKIEAKPEPKIEAKPEPKPEPKSEERFALASAVSVPARFVPQSAAPAPAVAEAAPAPAAAAPAAAPSPVSAPTPARPQQQVRSGWMIQVGAYQAEQEAKQRLTAVQNKAAKVLGGADPFTETVDKGGTTYYRARFAGLDKDKAEAACKYLKRNDVECVAIKN